MNKFLDKAQFVIESYLTKKQEKKLAKKNAKKTLKSEAIDWVNSLLFAVVVVFFVSLYFVQLFVIPSASMETTLMVQDRVGVSKRSYGTEPFAFGPKTSKRLANRGDIVIFYNPEYKSKGAFRENVSNALFLITLSLYNPSKEEKLFVKRAVGQEGDIIRFENGDVFIKPYSNDIYIPENAFINAYKPLRVRPIAGYQGSDPYTKAALDSQLSYSFEPYSTLALSDYNKFKNGVYIPKGHILPLGDNRDNSYDGRYFGPVSMKKVIGRGIFRFWPINKFTIFR